MANIKYYRQAIKRNMEVIKQHLQTDELLPALYSHFVVNDDEYQELGRVSENKGTNYQAKTLVDIMLQKDDRQLVEFVQLMRENRNEALANIIEETTRKMWSGEMRSDVATLD